MRLLTSREKWFYLFTLVVVFIAAANPFKSSDSFYDLKTGQLIWETGSVPKTDVFSSSAAGARWVSHEWLAQLLFYGAYRVGSYTGVIVGVAALAVITFFVVIQTARLRGSSVTVAALLAIIIGYLPFDLWVPRPQVFSFFAFALVLFFLESYRVRKAKQWLYSTVVVIWFWTNVNASVLLGLVMVVFYAGAELLKHSAPRILGRPELSIKDGIHIAIAFFAALAISFANPNTYRVLFYRRDIQEGIQRLNILEWYPITYFYSQWDTRLFLLELIVPVAFLLWYLGFRKDRRDLTSLGMVVGIGVMPFIAIRMTGYWPLAVTPFLAQALTFVLARWPARRLASGAFAVMAVLLLLRVSRIPARYYNPATVPVRAVDFIQENRLRGPLFNLYNDGGYLLWRLWPQERVFVDARAEVYNGRPFNELFAIVGNAASADKLINETYRFNYMVLGYHPDSLFRWIRPLLQKLAADRWPLVYWDDTVVVFVRPAPENKDIIQKYALWHVNPFRPPHSIPAAESELAKSEIDALLQRVPESEIVQYYAQQFAASRSPTKRFN